MKVSSYAGGAFAVMKEAKVSEPKRSQITAVI